MPSLSTLGGISLALLGLVSAHKPKLAHRHPRGGPVVEVVEYETVVHVVTVTVPHGYVAPAAPTPTPEPEPVIVYHPKPSSAKPSPQPVYTPEPEPEPETYSPPASSGNQGPQVDGVNILEVANYWRAKAGKAPFKWDDELASISQETTDINQGGVQMKHHPGARHNTAEVICPGPNFSNQELKAIGGNAFEAVYTGWLCEVPTSALTNDGGINWCSEVVSDILSLNVAGQTGHADILNSDSYSKIGCAYSDNPGAQGKKERGFPWSGQWACNLI
ncbi:hypothetical protein M501DRAFT_1015837 [Patellaria atrata CBS 101060]|uniref:SCP domain-containing protein n=1 Tax=Patellaria atrata CBS 101060 TaxID=1346257 RepID=A0A9P4VTN7_9PEZI|nr:hypothetical protein M501DRAFT_1015837 [Patellaria atrata CBS 101060]